jgi:hypothetical protein
MQHITTTKLQQLALLAKQLLLDQRQLSLLTSLLLPEVVAVVVAIPSIQAEAVAEPVDIWKPLASLALKTPLTELR